jgi:membrane-associated phospholipid phosphatase
MNLPQRFFQKTASAAAPASIWRELALQDWIAAVYLAVLLAVTVAGDGPRRTTALAYLSIDITVFVIAIGLTRGKILIGIVAAIVYRLGIFAAVFGTFAHLQYILPTARGARLDAEIYAFDKRVFGVEPAELFDRFVTTSTVEWFSFFYFGYFFILAVHVFPFMFTQRKPRLLAEISFGLVTLFCVGHILYIVVPGYGPYQHLAFRHELEGPLWWPLVKATVDVGEVRARTDIFPSLHTAAPAFLALFSIRHRRLRPFRVTWLPMTVFASQIALSTMFLRWHYLIDVIAGLALAIAVALLSARVARWEEARRTAGTLFV